MNRLVMFLAAAMLSAPALAEDPQSFTIEIKDHKFSPASLEVPAGKKVKLLVKNLDTTAEEFESHDLKREKIVKGGGEITVAIGPLKPGTYKYFGEFNMDTAQGVIIAK